MKKTKNKGEEGGYVEVNNTKDGKPQKPKDNKALEKKWKEFVKESQKPVEKNKTLKDTPKPPKPIGEKIEKPQKTNDDKLSDGKDAKEAPKAAAMPAKEKTEKKVKDPEEAKTPKTQIKDYLETDVDKLYELARDKGIIKVRDAAKMLKIEIDQVEEWGRILEEHKLVRLRYPPVGEPVLILKKFTADAEIIKAIKDKKKLRPARKVFLINLVILLCFAAVVSFYTIRFGAIRITYAQAYLAAGAIIIITGVLIYVLKFKKKGAKNGKKNAESGRKQPEG
jgi:hypothetical protein